ncbi:MAG: hypothetical protein WAN69_10735 [Candidatus Korobacteraceae bacterium]
MENYFNYFTEIEEHFQRRRGALSLLSPLDWALMEIWKDAGIPLEAVIRGMDTSFDKWERRPKHTRKVNSLAYCAQEVLAAAEEMKEAAVGSGSPDKNRAGLDTELVSAFLRQNADGLERGSLPDVAQKVAVDTAAGLRVMADGLAGGSPPPMEDVERRLTVMEEKLFAALQAGCSEDELLAIRTDADRDLAPYRGRMTAPQIEQLHRQYVHKRLLEQHHLPRLSLFYMP